MSFERLRYGILLLVWSTILQAAPEVTPNFPNTTQTPGALLSGINAPQQGRTAIIAYHGGILFTIPEMPASFGQSDFQVRAWNIADPRNPVELAQLGQTPHPVDAHGFFKTDTNLVLGSDYVGEGGQGPWNFRATGSNNRVERVPLNSNWFSGYSSRGDVFGPRHIWPTIWSYNAIPETEFSLGHTMGENRLDPHIYTTFDHLGMTGVIGQGFIVGNTLIIASDQSRTGVATYDISDLQNPVLLDVLKTGGPGGYFPELWGENGRLFVFFPHRAEPRGFGFQVVEVTDPTDIRHVGDFPLTGDEPMYVQFQDHYAFTGSHKIDMRTYQSVLNLNNADVVRNDGGTGINVSQFALPVGNLLVTGGAHENQGMAIWAHQAEPDTNPPSVGFHIPRASQTNYPVDAVLTFLIHETLESFTIVNGDSFMVREVNDDASYGDPIPGVLVFSYNDILTFTPDNPLQSNRTYEVLFSERGIKDAAGNGMHEYRYTFSTGDNVSGNQPPVITNLSTPSSAISAGQAASIAVSGTDDSESPLQYRFDFGDGSPRTEWQNNASTTVSYGQDGHYRILAQVRDVQGLVSSASQVITVKTERPTSSAQAHSGPMALDLTNRQLWTVNPDNDTVSILDMDSLSLINEIPACQRPFNITQVQTTEFWVTCKGSDEILIFNQGGEITQSLPLDYGSAPAGIVASSDAVFIALEGKGSVAKYSASAKSLMGQTDLGRTPRALAINENQNRLLVTRFISDVNQAHIWELAADSLNLVETIEIDKIGGPQHRDGTAEGKGVLNYLSSVVMSNDGQRAWLTATKTNTDRGPLTGVDLDEDNTVRTVVVELDLASNQVLRNLDLDNSDSASHVSFSPLEDYLFVTLQGSNKVMIFDLLVENAVGLGSFIASLETGSAPQGVIFDPSTNDAFIKNFLDRSVSRFDTSEFFAIGDINVTRDDLLVVQNEQLSQQVLRGKQLFYHADDQRMSGEGYLSCATCHNDGDSDGRVWDFTGRGEGLRNTTSLLGKSGMGQGNVHWTGNFDEIQDFENDIRAFFGGEGFLSETDFNTTQQTLGAPKSGLNSDLDALSAYVSSLTGETLKRSPYRTSEGQLTEAAIAGQAIFEQLQCASCHSGTEYTDSVLGIANLHNVGTISTYSGGRLGAQLTGLDTPTLLGVWDNAPYFHDGSAQTLQEVFQSAGVTIYPAEESSLSGSSQLTDRWTELNQDGSVRGGAFATVQLANSAITFAGIDGGSGGEGLLRIRYSSDANANVTLRINQQAIDLFLPATGGLGTNWQALNLAEQQFEAGTANTVSITMRDQWGRLAIDEIGIANVEQLTLANAHTQVQQLSESEQNELISFLLQLDGSELDAGETPTNLPPVVVLSAAQDVTSGDSVQLDASLSTDPENEALTYIWQQVTGPSVTITGSDQANASFVAPETSALAILEFQVTVSDPHDASDSAVTRVTVSPQQLPSAIISGVPESAESGSNISLNAAQSSDPQGQTLTFLWEQISGPELTLDNASSVDLQFVLPVVETEQRLELRLTVTNTDGLTAQQDISFMVTPLAADNTLPVIEINAPTETAAGSYILLDASNSHDAESEFLQFEWRQSLGDSVEIPWPNSSKIHLHIPGDFTSQTLAFALTVTDGDGGIAEEEVQVVVTANAPPIIVIEAPTEVNAGKYVQILGSGTYDPEEHGLTYHWQQVSGTAISIDWPNSANLGFHAPLVESDETLTFEFTVKDDLEAEATQQVAVLVKASAAPVIVVEENHQGNAGDYLSISASGSYDPDGDDLTYNWEHVSGPEVNLPWPNSPNIGFHLPSLETDQVIKLRVTATDHANTSSSKEVLVTVNRNLPPVISVSHPETVNPGQYVALNAYMSTDPEGHSLSFLWVQTAGEGVDIGDGQSGYVDFSAPDVESDSVLQFTLTVTDKYGAQSVENVSVTVKGNKPPEIVVPTQLSLVAGEHTTISAAQSSDPEGQGLQFYWEQTSGPEPKSAWGHWGDTLNLTAPEDSTGTMVFVLTVTDALGKIATQTVNVQITQE